jgi:acetylglutamate kinase
VTSTQDIDTLRMALSGAANKRIVSRLRAEGIDAIGLSGEDAGLLVSRAMDAERYGLVGEPSGVNVRLLRQLLGAGLLPVLSPVSAGETPGEALNVNGDDAASAIASALGARDLLLVADVPGVLVDGAVVPALRASEAEALVASGVAAGGMGAKVQAALAALARGVARVRIGDLAAIEDTNRGTTFLADEAQGTHHDIERRSVA